MEYKGINWGSTERDQMKGNARGATQRGGQKEHKGAQGEHNGITRGSTGEQREHKG